MPEIVTCGVDLPTHNKGETIKKILVLVLALTFTNVSTIWAQLEGVSFSGGVEIGLPSGDAADSFDWDAGFGISVTGEKELKENINVGAKIGFMRYPGELDFFGQTINTDLNVIPVVTYGEYFINESIYGTANLGYSIISLADDDAGSADSGTSFGLGAGYVLNEQIDISLGYQFVAEDFNSLNIRVAFNF